MRILNIIIFLIHTLWLSTALVQEVTVDSSLDKSIENFLDQHKNSWWDMNIPAGDGKVLYDLIIKNNYT
ncbi:MAG: methyltransferase, partial [Calditrichia bacterium]|nr:methyltransferase [Calditrichia bacterium]